MPRANEAAAAALREYADLLALAGEDRFRIRSYENAARSVAGSQHDVTTLDVKGLTAIPYVGKSIAEKVHEWVTTGRIAKLDDLRAKVGVGVRDLLDVPGLGPKRAALLHELLGVTTVDELRDAARDGKLRDLDGFGRVMEEKILAATAQAPGERRVHVGTALGLAEELVAALAALPAVEDVAYAGSLRRVRETIGDLDLLVAAAPGDAEAVAQAFVTLPDVDHVLAHGGTKSSVVTKGGVQVDLRVVDPGVWGAALIYFTGSKAHNVKLRERAIQRGWKLSEHGLFEGEKVVAAGTEEQVYAALDLPWIPPPLREDRGEIEAAAKGELPGVVQLRDIRGDLHGHTDLTDGVATLEEMVAAAQALGYAYYAVTDHAPLLSMQRMTADKALEQRERVRALDARSKITLLHGSELNIQEDGSLDWDEEFLDGFDVLVASVHSHFDLPRDAMTRRLVRAIEHPCVNVIGHPTARRYAKRPSIDFDAGEVCRAAARTGTALEINGQPERMDLPADFIRAARDYGVTFAISTDSHATTHLDFMQLGVGNAQRGWVEKGDVVNARSLRDLKRFLAKGRRGRP